MKSAVLPNLLGMSPLLTPRRFIAIIFLLRLGSHVFTCAESNSDDITYDENGILDSLPNRRRRRTPRPTTTPTHRLTWAPTTAPTHRPTSAPTAGPTRQPTSGPTSSPVPGPTDPGNGIDICLDNESRRELSKGGLEDQARRNLQRYRQGDNDGDDGGRSGRCLRTAIMYNILGNTTLIVGDTIDDCSFIDNYFECLQTIGRVNGPFWFNRDVDGGAFLFSTTQSSQAFEEANDHSFEGIIYDYDLSRIIVEYLSVTLRNQPASTLEYLEFKFFPDCTRLAQPENCFNHFFLSIYLRLTGLSKSFFDCRLDYVPNTGLNLQWNTYRVSAFDSATRVVGACPGITNPSLSSASASGYVLGTHGIVPLNIAFSLNMGDKTSNDNGLVGYFDDVRLKLVDQVDVLLYDF